MIEAIFASPVPAIWLRIWGCNIKAIVPAIMAERKSTMSDDMRRDKRKAVRRGTSSVQSEMLNVRESPSVYWFTSTIDEPSLLNPEKKKMMSVMVNEGTVV